MSEKKTCTGCNMQHSEEWTITSSLIKSNRKLFVAVIISTSLWLATTLIFGVHLRDCYYPNANESIGAIEEVKIVDNETKIALSEKKTENENNLKKYRKARVKAMRKLVA